jgi:MYXO-CTERM domain-containing protein
MKRTILAAAGVALAATAANAQYAIVNSMPGAFIDISGTGTDLNLNADDSTVAFNSTIGNAILAAGALRVSSNGNVQAGTTNSAFSNVALPAAGFTNAMFPYWDDMRTDNTGGDVFAQNLADRTIIQWNNIGTFAGGSGTGTFQVQIFNGSSGILAQFIYVDVEFGGAADFGGSATIGVQTPAAFAQWSFNQPDAVRNGTILTVTPAPSALALLGLGGLVASRRRRA